VDKETCIACGACGSAAPDIFGYENVNYDWTSSSTPSSARWSGGEERFKALVKYRDEALKYLEERR